VDERLELVKRILELELQTAGNLGFNFGAHHGKIITGTFLAGSSAMLDFHGKIQSCILHSSVDKICGGAQVKVAADVRWGR
jgi:hypothetical protein